MKKFKFNRKQGQRRAFMKGLTHNLIMRGKITTTETRARAVRPLVERLVTIGRRGRVQDLRLLLRRLPKQSAEKLYHDIAPRYKERRGGYTRIVKGTRTRMRDSAKTATIEFI